MSLFHTVSKWSYVVIQFLALISTFVTFGAELIGESDPGGSSASWKWNEVDFVFVFVPGADGQSVTTKYDSGSDDPRVRGCHGGGQGLVALAVLSLLVFVLVSLPLALMRALGREHALPKLGQNMRLYTNVELAAAGWHAFSFFCQCVIWGGTCFRLVKQDEPAGASVKATGFAYVGFCCALVLLALGLMWYLRREKLLDGEASGLSSSSSTAGAGDNRAPFASVYNNASSEGVPSAAAPVVAPGGYGSESAPIASGGSTGATAGDGYQNL